MRLRRERARVSVVAESQSTRNKLMKKTLKKNRKVKQQKMKERRKLKQN